MFTCETRTKIRFLTFRLVVVFVDEEEEPERGQPRHVADQNVRRPRWGEQQRRLLRTQEHGRHCGRTEGERSVTLHSQAEEEHVCLLLEKTSPDSPAMISVTEPSPQWAQLKINLL